MKCFILSLPGKFSCSAIRSRENRELAPYRLVRSLRCDLRKFTRFALYLHKGLVLIFFLTFFVFPKNIFASSISLSDFSPTSITSPDQEVSVKVNVSINSDDGTIYYLRGVFAKDDSTNYCGYTWNGTNWFSGPYSTDEGWKKFLSVTISSQSATATLKAKIDSTDSGCKESGSYKFKVQRFTASGSPNFDDQNIQSLSVSLPSLTPTPNPTNTPVPTSVSTVTPNPTNTPKVPTNTPRPTAKILPTSRPTIYSDRVGLDKNTAKASPTLAERTGNTEVLGESTKNSEVNTPSPSKSSPYLFVWILIGLGVVCMGVSLAAAYKNIKKSSKT